MPPPCEVSSSLADIKRDDVLREAAVMPQRAPLIHARALRHLQHRILHSIPRSGASQQALMARTGLLPARRCALDAPPRNSYLLEGDLELRPTCFCGYAGRPGSAPAMRRRTLRSKGRSPAAGRRRAALPPEGCADACPRTMAAPLLLACASPAAAHDAPAAHGSAPLAALLKTALQVAAALLHETLVSG